MLDSLADKKYIGDRPIHRFRMCGRRMYDIEFNTKTNEVRLRLQPLPRSIVGDQGLDPDHIITLARDLIQELDKKVPCKENKLTIEFLNTAIGLQEARRSDRIHREVEGTNKP